MSAQRAQSAARWIAHLTKPYIETQRKRNRLNLRTVWIALRLRRCEVMKIAKRYLQKGETIYETKTYAGGGHQAARRRSEAFCRHMSRRPGNSAAEGLAWRLGQPRVGRPCQLYQTEGRTTASRGSSDLLLSHVVACCCWLALPKSPKQAACRLSKVQQKSH